MPQADGGVCSFLGTVDSTFNARGTLTVLEDKEHEDRLVATAADIDDKLASFRSGGPKKPANTSDGRSNTEPQPTMSGAKSPSKHMDSAVESENIHAENLTRALQALDKSLYPGVVPYKGKIAVKGTNSADAMSRLNSCLENVFGPGWQLDKTLGDNVLFYVRPEPKKSDDGSRAETNANTPIPPADNSSSILPCDSYPGRGRESAESKLENFWAMVFDPRYGNWGLE